MHASKCVVPNEDDLRFLREFLDFAQILQRHETLTGPTKSDASIALATEGGQLEHGNVEHPCLIRAPNESGVNSCCRRQSSG